MKTGFPGAPLLLTAVLLTGCATPPRHESALPPVEEPKRIPSDGVPEREPAVLARDRTVAPPLAGSEAVVALARRADGALAAGAGDRAAALLERALRIEPDNAWLWHRLARVRLRQGRHAEAIELARKSLSLSDGDPVLRALNRRLIRAAGGK